MTKVLKIDMVATLDLQGDIQTACDVQLKEGLALASTFTWTDPVIYDPSIGLQPITYLVLIFQPVSVQKPVN